MTRVCTTFPWTIENGSLAISSDADRDQQDIISVIFTRHYERILRPYLGSPDYIFTSTQTANLIAKKLDIAIEEQCPTIAQCNGIGRFASEGTMIVELFWSPKVGESRSIALRIT